MVHITGIRDYEEALRSYEALSGLGHRAFSFVDRIGEAYSASDLVVTRSGASVIFELAFFSKAMILVPYPFAMSHQTENANVFAASGAAVIFDEKILSAGVFKDIILGLFNDRMRLKRLGENARRLSVPEASENLAKEVFGLSER